MSVVEAEDLRAALLRLLAKLPPLEGFDRQRARGGARLEIEAGNEMFFALAADPQASRFFGGVVGKSGDEWLEKLGEYQIDAEGGILYGGSTLRIRHVTFEGVKDAAAPRTWEVTRLRKK